MDWILPLPLGPRVTAETLGSHSLSPPPPQTSPSPGGRGRGGRPRGLSDSGGKFRTGGRAPLMGWGGGFTGTQGKERVKAEAGGGSGMKGPVATLQESFRFCPPPYQTRFLDPIQTPDPSFRDPLPPAAHTQWSSPSFTSQPSSGFPSCLTPVLPPELSSSP